jgi:hypothetical protein
MLVLRMRMLHEALRGFFTASWEPTGWTGLKRDLNGGKENSSISMYLGIRKKIRVARRSKSKSRRGPMRGFNLDTKSRGCRNYVLS